MKHHERNDREQGDEGVSQAGIDIDARRLAGATLAAFILAIMVFLVAILPAGYGLDPLGTGALLGIQAEGEEEGAHSHNERTDAVELVLSPGHELRWGFQVAAGEWFDYAYNASAPVAPNVIADPEDEGEPQVILEGLEPTMNHTGGFRMPVSGDLVFIWSLPEDADEDVVVSFETSGSYRLLGGLR